MRITVEELADRVGGVVRGDGTRTIENVEALEHAGSADVAFVYGEGNLAAVSRTSAGAVLVDAATADRIPPDTPCPALVIVADPKAAFVSLLPLFRKLRTRPEIGISSQAFVSPSAKFGPRCNVHPGVTIADDVILGADCDVLPGAYIGPGCRLGDGVVVHPNAVLYHDVLVGNRVIIHASAVIGADGFGYQFEQGRYVRIPHVGTVHLHDDVEIGACATIDRGMIGPTVIGEGTKIDNLVMIGHNCKIGRHNAFASQVGLAGSVISGDYVRCAGQVGIADHLHLGDRSTLAAKAAVHKNVPAGETHIGYPAGKDTEQIRVLTLQSRLPEMRKQLRELEKQVAALTAKLASNGESSQKVA